MNDDALDANETFVALSEAIRDSVSVCSDASLTDRATEADALRGKWLAFLVLPAVQSAFSPQAGDAERLIREDVARCHNCGELDCDCDGDA